MTAADILAAAAPAILRLLRENLGIPEPEPVPAERIAVYLAARTALDNARRVGE